MQVTTGTPFRMAAKKTGFSVDTIIIDEAHALDDSDPVEGMASKARNTPTAKPLAPWGKVPPIPEGSGSLKPVGWHPVGPPSNTSDDELWRAFVTLLSDTYADCLLLKNYVFPRIGRRDRDHRTKRTRTWTAARVNRMVLRIYGDRLRVSARLFGLQRGPDGRWFVPAPVETAFTLTKQSLKLGDSVEARRLSTEAAHYVFVHGEPGLKALRATIDLEGAAGLQKLLDTWWRL